MTAVLLADCHKIIFRREEKDINSNFLGIDWFPSQIPLCITINYDNINIHLFDIQIKNISSMTWVTLHQSIIEFHLKSIEIIYHSTFLCPLDIIFTYDIACNINFSSQVFKTQLHANIASNQEYWILDILVDKQYVHKISEIEDTLPELHTCFHWSPCDFFPPVTQQQALRLTQEWPRKQTAINSQLLRSWEKNSSCIS
jgi:hypothetical protein